ncbi:NB-ARC domain-containing protein [Streptomyces boninensis]|uniref:NB-ARC domain-containing protein n=1 Tax=Streptomyces boninensis TaxID=2039455 RepID=UPI003B211B35
MRADRGSQAFGRVGTVNVYGDQGQGAAVWPLRLGTIPRQADSFQHRQAVDSLDAAVRGGGTAVLSQVQVLSGAGGVGKTQLAAHYARRQDADGDTALRLWVTADSRDAIVSAYAHACRRITGADPGADPRQAGADFVDWLATTDKRWLIVLDDLADPADLYGLWPPRRDDGHGRVVVTTRRRDASLRGSGRLQVQVGLFTVEESVAYLARTLAAHGREDDPAELHGLAEDLGCLPLALAQAAVFIVDRDLDCANYRRRLADRRRTLAQNFPADARADDYRATVAATWSLSIELADQLAPAGLARPMLQLVSVLSAHGIPERVLAGPPALGYLAERRTGGPLGPVTEDDAHDALRCLHRLSLVDLPAAGVVVHGLIQHAAREQLDEPALAEAVRIAAEALLDAWAQPQDADGESVLRANSDALHAHAGPRIWADGAHAVLVEANRSLVRAKLLVSAITRAEADRAEAEATAGAGSRVSAAARMHLAALRVDAGSVLRGRTELEELLAEQSTALGADDPLVLDIREEIVQLQGRSGDVAGAVGAAEDLLGDRLRVQGAADERTVRSWLRFAVFLAGMGDFEGALDCGRDIHAVRTRSLGPHHPLTVAVRQRMAHWLGESGDREGQRAELEALHSERAEALGPENPETIVAQARLARWWAIHGELEEALPRLEELLAVQTRTLGDGHADVAATGRLIAATRGESSTEPPASSPSQDLDTLERLLAEQQRDLGDDHSDTLTTRLRIANQRGVLGDFERALAECRSLLADRVRLQGTDHRDTLAVRGAVVELLHGSGEKKAALAALEELVDDHMRIVGPAGPATLAALGRLAHLRSNARDKDGAVAALQRIAAERSGALGADHLATLAARTRLARFRAEMGDRHRALTEFRALLDDRARVQGPGHRDTLAVFEEVAALVGSLQDWTAGVAAARALHEAQTEAYGPDAEGVLATGERIADWQARAGTRAADFQSLMDQLADVTSRLGADHPDTFPLRTELALLRRRSRNRPVRARALAELEALLADQERALGPVHPDVLRTRETVGTWRRRKGDLAGALDVAERQYEVQRDAFGAADAGTLRARLSVFQLHLLTGATMTLDDCTALVDDTRRALGPDHHLTFAARQERAEWRGGSGDARGAVADAEQLIEDRIRAEGETSPGVRFARKTAAHWHEELGQLLQALRHREQHLRACRAALGVEHPNTYRSMGARNRIDERVSREGPRVAPNPRPHRLRWRDSGGAEQEFAVESREQAEEMAEWARRGGGTAIEIVPEPRPE